MQWSGDARKMAASFIEAVEKFHPELAVVDILLQFLLNGLDACRHVKKSCPEVKIIILTMHAEQHVNEAFRVGVGGYVLKTSVADELLFAVKRSLQGRDVHFPGRDAGDAV